MKSKTFTKVLSTYKVKLVVFAVLLAVSIALPSFIHSQWVTGPIINAALLIALVTVGPMEAVVLGLMPSAIALSSGLLPIALAPMVPFIMLGNALLIMSFHYLRNQNYVLRLGVSAFLKLMFLHYSVVFIMKGFLDNTIISKLMVMMSWPQFFTAVIGGAIAYPIIKSLSKND